MFAAKAKEILDYYNQYLMLVLVSFKIKIPGCVNPISFRFAYNLVHIYMNIFGQSGHIMCLLENSKILLYKENVFTKNIQFCSYIFILIPLYDNTYIPKNDPNPADLSRQRC